MCGNHTLECVCSDLDSIPILPKNLVEKLECKLIHSRVPKMTENGIILVCKEGCDITHSLESESSLLSS